MKEVILLLLVILLGKSILTKHPTTHNKATEARSTSIIFFDKAPPKEKAWEGQGELKVTVVFKVYSTGA